MAREMLSKEMVCNIIKDHYDFHKGEHNTITENALAVLHNTFSRIEGVKVSDCSDCEYFLKSKGETNDE